MLRDVCILDQGETIVKTSLAAGHSGYFVPYWDLSSAIAQTNRNDCYACRSERSPMSGYPDKLPFESFELIVTENYGAVCTSQSLASEAGPAMLEAEGNAIDAALAAAAALAVVESAASHLSGAVVIVFHASRAERAYALNGSGSSPRSATPNRYPQGIPCDVCWPQRYWERCIASAKRHNAGGHFRDETSLRPSSTHARDSFPMGYRMS